VGPPNWNGGPSEMAEATDAERLADLDLRLEMLALKLE
jgi:hypothetical protein